MSSTADFIERSAQGSRAAVAGIVFAVLFLVGWYLLRRSPTYDESDEALIRYIGSSSRHRTSSIAALYVMPLAAVAFMWFAASLRDRVVHGAGREHLMLSTVHVLAATLCVTAIFLMGAIELALVWTIQAGAVDVDSNRSMVAIGNAVGQLLALRAGAVFVTVSTTRGLRSGLFPRWFGLASFAIAAVLLVVTPAWRGSMLVFPLWVVVTSVLVMRRRVIPPEPTRA